MVDPSNDYIFNILYQVDSYSPGSSTVRPSPKDFNSSYIPDKPRPLEHLSHNICAYPRIRTSPHIENPATHASRQNHDFSAHNAHMTPALERSQQGYQWQAERNAAASNANRCDIQQNSTFVVESATTRVAKRSRRELTMIAGVLNRSSITKMSFDR